MGIPSYYKKLVNTVKGLVSKTHPGSIDWLWMDFNCMIYHCLRRPDILPYPGEVGRITWEAHFIDEIAKYLLRVYSEVKPAKGIYIAIDGVVPMAKMRQQRLRRFKSVWLAENGLAEGAEAGRERWDTNAITPGTEFMSSLRKRLEQVVERRGTVSWSLSSSDEPGEGEHKIMEQWRTRSYDGSYAIYGLDADLIVLSLLNKGEHSVHLFRECIEDGSIVRDAVGNEEFSWFSIDVLRNNVIGQLGGREELLNSYCCAMSFLGNDFLPSSLSFKMREDGHDALIRALPEMRENLVDEVGHISPGGLREFIGWLARNEEYRTLRYVSRKMTQGKLYSDLPVGDVNWPLSEKREEILLNDAAPTRGLRGDWQDIYRNQLIGHSASIREMCDEYYRGIYWNWLYYTGDKDGVCYNWYYPWNMPPLWQWLAAHKNMSACAPDVRIRCHDILPCEQLCLVLPIQSWWLIGGNRANTLYERAPWLFPVAFGFDSVGKRYFWECEAEIPVPSICEVKAILA